jgi:hypothetical protein
MHISILMMETEMCFNEMEPEITMNQDYDFHQRMQRLFS